MTPATLTTPIYKGALYSHTFTFLQSGTVTPVNLTGLTPFVMTFKNAAGAILAHATVTVVGDLTDGVLSVSLGASKTKTFPLGENKVWAGIRDSQNNSYAQGKLDVFAFTPDPVSPDPA